MQDMLFFIFDINSGFKKQKAQKGSERDYSAGAGGYIIVHGTTKLGCLASLQVCTIQLYVDYTLPQRGILSNKGRDSQAVRTWQGKCQTPQHSNKVLFEASLQHKPWNTSCWPGWKVGHFIHPKIADKIHELVNENITSPDVVRECLEVLQRRTSLEDPTKDITQTQPYC